MAVERQLTNLTNVQSSWYQVRHLPVDLGEVAGVGRVEAAHKEVGPLHHGSINDVCAHYWGI